MGEIGLENLKSEYKNSNKELLVVGIGTDKIIYDSFGPMAATLSNIRVPGLNTVGTLYKTCNALNINRIIGDIDQSKYFILALDSAISYNFSKYKCVTIYKGKCSPGAGLGKKLISFGDAYITFNIGSDVIEEHPHAITVGDIYKASVEVADIVQYLIS